MPSIFVAKYSEFTNTRFVFLIGFMHFIEEASVYIYGTYIFKLKYSSNYGKALNW